MEGTGKGWKGSGEGISGRDICLWDLLQRLLTSQLAIVLMVQANCYPLPVLLLFIIGLGLLDAPRRVLRWDEG